MKTKDVLIRRLINQRLINTLFTKPNEIVSWMGAMQAQEYAMAKWAIGLRTTGLNETDVEQAFNNGDILRTHVLRPTWHFVAPEDIRWMLKLTAPRVHSLNAYYNKQRELDSKLLKRCTDIVARALEGGNMLTRNELKDKLAAKKIIADGERLGSIMMYAELEGIVCSGPRKGKQFTYALIDERVADADGSYDREQALHELTKRYFASRGPATAADFAWWSGLTMKDAREGIAILGKDFVHEELDGQEYIFMAGVDFTSKSKGIAFLMPDYDEYAIAYKDRSMLYDKQHDDNISRGNPVFNHVMVVDGKVAGTWKRIIKNGKAVVRTFPFGALNKRETRDVEKAISSYINFIDN